MSYTPEDQKIDESIDRLLAAIDDVRCVCLARIRAKKGSWIESHIDNLNDLRNDLNDLEIKLGWLHS